jgi:hypothetical protein
MRQPRREQVDCAAAQPQSARSKYGPARSAGPNRLLAGLARAKARGAGPHVERDVLARGLPVPIRCQRRAFLEEADQSAAVSEAHERQNGTEYRPGSAGTVRQDKQFPSSRDSGTAPAPVCRQEDRAIGLERLGLAKGLAGLVLFVLAMWAFYVIRLIAQVAMLVAVSLGLLLVALLAPAKVLAPRSARRARARQTSARVS